MNGIGDCFALSLIMVIVIDPARFGDIDSKSVMKQERASVMVNVNLDYRINTTTLRGC